MFTEIPVSSEYLIDYNFHHVGGIILEFLNRNNLQDANGFRYECTHSNLGDGFFIYGSSETPSIIKEVVERYVSVGNNDFQVSASLLYIPRKPDVVTRQFSLVVPNMHLNWTTKKGLGRIRVNDKNFDQTKITEQVMAILGGINYIKLENSFDAGNPNASNIDELEVPLTLLAQRFAPQTQGLLVRYEGY